jgi:hypothetical protein
MERSINFEDLFDWQVESDRHYIMLLERHKQEEWEWNLMEEERNRRLPAIIQVLIPTKQSYETKSKSLAL